jgi:hypothetical protein
MVVENADGNELKFKNPERLLVVVIGFIFWSVGFIDLLGHTSATPVILGLYSIPLFGLIVLYGLSGITWVVLFVSPKILSKVVAGIEKIQSKTWLVLTILAILAVSLWVILEWDRWASFPGLQVTAFFLVLLAAAVLIFTGWSRNVKNQGWRKLLAYPLFALLAVEIVIQAAAWAGVLPGTHTIGGNFVPYERVYYNAEGLRNGMANRYGWYYPDAAFNDDARKILIFGTSQAQALQVDPEQQVGAILSDMINQGKPNDDVETEVITIGLPGFGPGPYLYEAFMQEFIGEIKPDEIIVLFHLADDFQSETPQDSDIAYTVTDGVVDIRPESTGLRHDLSHFFLRGYYSFQFVETIRSHFLTPKVVSGLIANTWSNTALATVADKEFDMPRLKGSISDKYAITEPSHSGVTAISLQILPGSNDFMFEKEGNVAADESISVAASLLKLGPKYEPIHGFNFRLVTIPKFPASFYSGFQSGSWEPDMGDYDLFLPEKALGEIAQNESITMLPMGQHMMEDELTVDEIRSLYYLDGLGHLTPAGHEYFAKAIYSCFFAPSEDNDSVACAQN